MRQRLIKAISIALCTTTLSLSSIYIAPAFAAENTDTTNTETPHKFVPSILREQEIEMSKIPKDHVYIPAKTKIDLSLTQTIDSKTAHKGDPVEFKTLSNIIVNNVIVIPAGTLVSGTITKARSAGGMGRSGKLEFTVTSINTINNVAVPLSYNSSKSGQGDGGAVAVFAAVSIIGGLFMKGTNVQCVAGTKIETSVSDDTDLNVTFDNLADAMDVTKPHGVSITLK